MALRAVSVHLKCVVIAEQKRDRSKFLLFSEDSVTVSLLLSMSDASALSLVPANSSSRIRQRCCHARLEPELPPLIAALRLREADRAETAHKDAG